jgi:hypothetical protein
MPISIRRIKQHSEENTSLAWLGDGEWNLPSQIDLLESWINTNVGDLPPGEYVADVGFCWRRDAGGGVSALSPDFLIKLGSAGFSIFLSEYPGFSDGDEESKEAEQDVHGNTH